MRHVGDRIGDDFGHRLEASPGLLSLSLARPRVAVFGNFHAVEGRRREAGGRDKSLWGLE